MILKCQREKMERKSIVEDGGPRDFKQQVANKEYTSLIEGEICLDKIRMLYF